MRRQRAKCALRLLARRERLDPVTAPIAAVARSRRSRHIWANMLRFRLLLATISLLAMGCDAVLSIHGRVVDEQGAAIAGAKVSVYRDRTKATSNEEGCFDLDTITPRSKHEAPLTVEVDGIPAYRGKVPAPGFLNVNVRLSRTGEAGSVVVEETSTVARCPDHRAP